MEPINKQTATFLTSNLIGTVLHMKDTNQNDLTSKQTLNKSIDPHYRNYTQNHFL